MMMAEMITSSRAEHAELLAVALDGLEQQVALRVVGVDRHVAPAGEDLGHLRRDPIPGVTFTMIALTFCVPRAGSCDAGPAARSSKQRLRVAQILPRQPRSSRLTLEADRLPRRVVLDGDRVGDREERDAIAALADHAGRDAHDGVDVLAQGDAVAQTQTQRAVGEHLVVRLASAPARRPAAACARHPGARPVPGRRCASGLPRYSR